MTTLTLHGPHSKSLLKINDLQAHNVSQWCVTPKNYMYLDSDPHLEICSSRDLLPQKQRFELKRSLCDYKYSKICDTFSRFSISRHSVARYELCRSAIFEKWWKCGSELEYIFLQSEHFLTQIFASGGGGGPWNYIFEKSWKCAHFLNIYSFTTNI